MTDTNVAATTTHVAAIIPPSPHNNSFRMLLPGNSNSEVVQSLTFELLRNLLHVYIYISQLCIYTEENI